MRTIVLDDDITPAEVAAALTAPLAGDTEDTAAGRAVVKVSDYSFSAHVALFGGVTYVTRAKLLVDPAAPELVG